LGKRALAKANYYTIIIKHFHSLFVSRVREATASVRRTQLAVVRRKSTKLAASPPRGPVTKLGQLTRDESPLALLEPFSLLFSTTGVDQGDL
jgi:hypothetical protein